MEEICNHWDRQPGKPNKWYSIFTEYRMLGPNRTLVDTYRKLRPDQPLPASNRLHIPGGWKDNAGKWRWKERAEAWDTELYRVSIAQEEARQRDVLTTGLPIKANRVEALNELAKKLCKEAMDPNKRWLKEIRGGLEVIHFNAGLIEQCRGVLADIAKEMGHRTTTMDVTTNGENINQGIVIILPEKEWIET
ncbi:MAG: hypothetical protein C0391_09150 [Anaerolinea sp.]|nr:hypothetical protein [Anaerolinea sp.]